jgi:RimJ/RimL family protein N-acetyltransferase
LSKVFEKLEIIETESLILRDINLQDVGELFKFFSDFEVMKYNII